METGHSTLTRKVIKHEHVTFYIINSCLKIQLDIVSILGRDLREDGTCVASTSNHIFCGCLMNSRKVDVITL